jgi:hypothetical protein
MSRVRLLILAAALVALAGCHQKAHPPGDAPTNVKATPGDGVVLMTWDVLPDLTYWIFYRAGETVSAAETGSTAIRRAFEPRIVAGLANDTTYAFVMNATNNDSAAGPSSPVVTALTRLAGDIWTSGTAAATTPQNLNAVAFAGTIFVAVGDAGTVLTGIFDYASDAPPGVISWVPATFPSTANLVSVLWNGVSAFDVLAADGTTFTSPDGLNWTQQGTIPSGGMTMNSLTFGFLGTVPTFIAVGNGGALFTSNDLKTWTPGQSNSTNDLNNIQVQNGYFMATGANGTLIISQEGEHWFPQTTGTTETLRSIAFSPFNPNIEYVVVGDGGAVVTTPIILRSPDPTLPPTVTWTASVIPGAPNLRSVTDGGASLTRFLAVGLAGSAVYSDDGTTWNPPKKTPPSGDLSSVIFANPMYMAVGAAGASAVSR